MKASQGGTIGMCGIAKLTCGSAKQLPFNRSDSIPNAAQIGIASTASQLGRGFGSVTEGGQLFEIGLARLPRVKPLQFHIVSLLFANVAWLILSGILQSRCAIHQTNGLG